MSVSSKTPEERGINFIKSMCSKVILTDNNSDNIIHREFDFHLVKGYIFTLKDKLLLRLKEPETELYIERIFKNGGKPTRVIIKAAYHVIERSMSHKSIEALTPDLTEQPKNLSEALFISICKIIKNKKKDELETIDHVKRVINEMEAFIIEKEKAHILQDLNEV
jgi:hypothetical protein